MAAGQSASESKKARTMQVCQVSCLDSNLAMLAAQRDQDCKGGKMQDIRKVYNVVSQDTRPLSLWVPISLLIPDRLMEVGSL